MKNTYILIPARAGSKGVPGKNLKKLCGNSLILYTSAIALESTMVKKVVVSTDIEEIINAIPEIHPANRIILKRPPELAQDNTPIMPVIRHFQKHYKDCEILVLLQPTSPLRPPGCVDDALKKFIEGGYDSMLSLSPTHKYNWNVKDGKAIPEMSQYLRKNRQDQETKYIENGSLYISRLKGDTLLYGNIGYVIFDQIYSYEIDTPADFAILEALMKYNIKACKDAQIGRLNVPK